MKLCSLYVTACLPVLTSSSHDVVDSILQSSAEESTEFFTGKVHYGVSRESGEPKVGNHPVTYDSEGNILIKILAKPNASKTIIGGADYAPDEIGAKQYCSHFKEQWIAINVTTKVERLGMRIAAPPVNGEANKEMLKFLAKVLNVKKSALSIVEESGDFKTVKVVAGILFIEDLLTKLMDAQYMKPSHIGHPDYMKILYIDED